MVYEWCTNDEPMMCEWSNMNEWSNDPMIKYKWTNDLMNEWSKIFKMTYLQTDDISPMVSRDFRHNIRLHTGARVNAVLFTDLLTPGSKTTVVWLQTRPMSVVLGRHERQPYQAKLITITRKTVMSIGHKQKGIEKPFVISSQLQSCNQDRQTVYHQCEFHVRC